MGKKPNRNYENDGKEDKTKALQKKIKDQEKEINRLKSELKTLNKAFQKSAAYMSSQSKPLTVEALIKAADKNQTLEQAKQEQEKEGPEDVREKIKKWREERFGKYEEE